MAAITAERDLVPVVIVETADSAETERIIDQWHENQHRRGLSVAGLSIIQVRPTPVLASVRLPSAAETRALAQAA